VAVDALVGADFAIVKSVEVDALAVDFLEAVSVIGGRVHVAGGIDGDRSGEVLDIHFVEGIADAAAEFPVTKGRSRGRPGWRHGRSRGNG